MSKAGSNINVTVRVRPLSSKETGRSSWNCLAVQDGRQINVSDPDDKMGGIDYLRLDKTKTKHYRLDSVFGPESTQAAVYAATARPLARKVVEGYNACCFAYGATGAGKTFTMTGTLDDPGVIPLTLDDLVLVAAEQKEEYDVKISMQYVEIYNEKLKDLLNPQKQLLHSLRDLFNMAQLTNKKLHPVTLTAVLNLLRRLKAELGLTMVFILLEAASMGIKANAAFGEGAVVFDRSREFLHNLGRYLGIKTI